MPYDLLLFLTACTLCGVVPCTSLYRILCPVLDHQLTAGKLDYYSGGRRPTIISGLVASGRLISDSNLLD